MAINIGDIFDQLTITKLIGRIEQKDRSNYWESKCSCGIAVIRSTAELNRGKKKGTFQGCKTCAQSNNTTKEKGLSSWRLRYNGYMAGAKNRDYSFDISESFFIKICQQNCHYCSAEPSPNNRYITATGKLPQKYSVKSSGIDNGWILTNGIDRRDNSIGYTESNCLPCCSTCNKMKGTMSYQDFINQVNKIRVNHNA